MNNYYFVFFDDLHNLLFSIFKKKLCIKWIKKGFKFAMHFGWFETKKVNFCVMHFIY